MVAKHAGDEIEWRRFERNAVTSVDCMWWTRAGRLLWHVNNNAPERIYIQIAGLEGMPSDCKEPHHDRKQRKERTAQIKPGRRLSFLLICNSTNREAGGQGNGLW